MSNNLVSIITPTYNCGKFIGETIESVLAQSYPYWEMIIVDDCSTDNTREIVSQYTDSRIKYICLEKNSGAAIARNMALQLAQGRWIAFLDSDDLWKREKLKNQLAFMQKNDYGFTYHEYDEIDENSKLIGVTVSGKKKLGKFDMFACCWPGCLAVMYDANKIGCIQIENVKKDNDSAIWLKAIKKQKCYLLKENLALYRRRQGSITPTGLISKVKWHYHLFRIAEKMNPISSFFLMCMNVFGNAYKKIFYVKKSINH